jgi:hypothetical protein
MQELTETETDQGSPRVGRGKKPGSRRNGGRYGDDRGHYIDTRPIEIRLRDAATEPTKPGQRWGEILSALHRHPLMRRKKSRVACQQRIDTLVDTGLLGEDARRPYYVDEAGFLRVRPVPIAATPKIADLEAEVAAIQAFAGDRKIIARGSRLFWADPVETTCDVFDSADPLTGIATYRRKTYLSHRQGTQLTDTEAATFLSFGEESRRAVTHFPA